MKLDVDARARLKTLVEQAGSQRAAAREIGVGESYIGDLLHGRRKFSDFMLAKLGLRRTVIAAK